MINKKYIFLLVMNFFFAFQLCSNGNDSCIICYEQLYNKKDDILMLACSVPDAPHMYHFKCIDEWKKKNATCPVCRFSLSENIDEDTLDEKERKIKRRVYQYTLSKPTYEVLHDTSQDFCKDLISLLKTLCIHIPRD